MTTIKFLIAHVFMFIACAIVCTEPYTIARVHEENVQKHIVAFEKEFVFNNKLRKLATVGLTIGGTAAVSGLVYLMFFAETGCANGTIVPPQEEICSVERISRLEAAVRALIARAPRFGSLAWAKSWAWYLAGSSFVVGNVLDKIIYYSSAAFNKIFYDRSLSWFLAARTQIGSMVIRRIDGREEWSISWADTVKELEQSVTALQDEVVDDEDDHKKRIAKNLSIIMNDVELIIAFTQHWLSTIRVIYAGKQDLCDRMHHIRTLANKVAENLENLLNAPLSTLDKARCFTLVKCFCSSIEQELVGVMRGEQEMLVHACPL